MGIKSLVKQILTEQQNRKYTRLLENKTVSYDRWIQKKESTCAWKTETAELSNSDFICCCMPEGRLATGALKYIGRWFSEHPECALLYGDEDIVEGEDHLQGNAGTGKRKLPWFKPDWSPDLLKCSFYFGGLVAMRRAEWEQMLSIEKVTALSAVGVEPADKTALVDVYPIIDVVLFGEFIRRCVARMGGYRRNSHEIQHVPEILFHGYSEDVRKHFAVRELPAVHDTRATLSIIIPSKDNPDILQKCLSAIPSAAGQSKYEVVIVDNGSSKENKQKIEALVEAYSAKMSESGMVQQEITYLYHPQEFNFSQMCNMGAEAAKGDLLLFLNDDVELAQEISLEKMAELAIQEYTGAVGIKLYYPDSKRIQHAGITNLPMGPVHKLQFLDDDRDYYFSYNRGCRNVLAVTAACLMVEKEKYRQAGGFSQELRVAFNDVDFCFRLYELGYSNVCRNDCFAYHHESLSRGDDESAEKLHRLLAERDKLYQRHPQLVGLDPYYNVGLGRDGLDTRIRPAYETAGNELQVFTGALPQVTLQEYRQDNCLLFRVEDSREGTVQGYGVVLGDNNACYERRLVLDKLGCMTTSDDKAADAQKGPSEMGQVTMDAEAVTTGQGTSEAVISGQGICYAVVLDGQYRPDLMENLPDQTNVGLCGVWIHLSRENLPAGSYRLGMAVRNRVTGMKLVNWSNRTLEIDAEEI